VDAHRKLLTRVFTEFAATGQWPQLEVLQREFDRRTEQVDVRQLIDEMPRPPGAAPAADQMGCVIPIALLRYMPEAERYLRVCAAIVRKAVDLYMNSDASPLNIRSDDSDLVEEADGELDVVVRAGQLLYSAYPRPFPQALADHQSWLLLADGSARAFRDVTTINDYLDRQSVIRARDLPGAAHHTKSGQKELFVMMPFVELWSLRMYEFIQRAVKRTGDEPSGLSSR